MTTTANAVRFLGTTDEVETCDCCGRSNLKVTVALLFADADEAVYFGTTCAARALSMPAKEIRKAAKSMDDAHADAIREEAERVARAEFARWERFVRRETEDGYGWTLFGGIQKLGGYAAARAQYLAWQQCIAA